MSGTAQFAQGIAPGYYWASAFGSAGGFTRSLSLAVLTLSRDDVLVDDNNGVLTKYINGPGVDNKLKMTTNGTVRYFVTDHLGSTNALTDATGAIVEQTKYDSFGNATSNLSTRYQFTGREFDNLTGLHYYRARWYDASVGRFISEDPIGLAGGINQYGYVGGNPQNLTDPSGLIPPNGVAPVVQTITQTAAPLSPLLEEILANHAEKQRNARLLAEVLANYRPAAAAVSAGGAASLVAYGGTSVAVAGAAPVAATIAAGAAIGGVIGLPIGILTSESGSNPFVYGNWNPLGQSANEVLSEPWTPGTPVEACKVHGNSAASLRPTWGYKLYDLDGNFLKNGITSQVNPEKRYTNKSYETRFMVPIEQFPNRRTALDWERGQNMSNPGPLNFERYIKR